MIGVTNVILDIMKMLYPCSFERLQSSLKDPQLELMMGVGV